MADTLELDSLKEENKLLQELVFLYRTNFSLKEELDFVKVETKRRTEKYDELEKKYYDVLEQLKEYKRKEKLFSERFELTEN